MLLFEHWLVVEIQYKKPETTLPACYCMVSTAQILIASTSRLKSSADLLLLIRSIFL